MSIEVRGAKVLRLPAVKARVSLSKSHIYAEIARGRFPRPFALGERASGWLESDIDGWLAERINSMRSGSQA